MPVYNAERFLSQAVESVLSQSFREFKFIIIDDGSSDQSLRILNEFAAKDSRILLRSRANTGYSAALNEGLALAQGRYIARMDADDVCRPTRFEKQLAFMENNPQCVAVGSYAEYMDVDGWPIYVVHRPTEHEAIDEMHIRGVGGAILHPAAMLRTDALRQVGGYRTEFEPAEDADLFLRLAEVGRLANRPEVLLNYRFNMASISFTRLEIQSRRLQRAIDEARDRRGLPPNRNLPKPRRFSRVRYEGSIIYHSLRAGHVCTSVKHLLAVIRFYISAGCA
jgi:glycosyltransferase involved in cell wall biosynthesis